MALLLAASLLRGEESLIVTGQIIIPGPMQERPYTFKGSLTITREKIEIRCAAKIFRLFNTFKNPRQYKLSIDTKEVDEILVKEDRLYIYPTVPLYHRYRNIFKPFWTRKPSYGLDMITTEYQVLIFHLDTPQVAITGAGVIAAINIQAEKLRKKHGHRGTGKYVD